MLWKAVDPSKVHRLLYPQVPVVVTAEAEGRIGGMAAIWCVPLSFKPVLVGVAVARDHETSRIISAAGAFGVNWLEFTYAERVGELGETSAKTQSNKLAAVGLKTIRGHVTSQPLIEEASACLECRVVERHRVGTHDFLIGEVAAASANAHFSDYWDFTSYNPLLYAGTVDVERRNSVFRSIRGESLIVPLKHQP